jgi:hypothetical protein
MGTRTAKASLGPVRYHFGTGLLGVRCKPGEMHLESLVPKESGRSPFAQKGRGGTKRRQEVFNDGEASGQSEGSSQGEGVWSTPTQGFRGLHYVASSQRRAHVTSHLRFGDLLLLRRERRERVEASAEDEP